jgi:hypothetical protein
VASKCVVGGKEPAAERPGDLPRRSGEVGGGVN